MSVTRPVRPLQVGGTGGSSPRRSHRDSRSRDRATSQRLEQSDDDDSDDDESQPARATFAPARPAQAPSPIKFAGTANFLNDRCSMQTRNQSRMGSNLGPGPSLSRTTGWGRGGPRALSTTPAGAQHGAGRNPDTVRRGSAEAFLASSYI